MKHEIAIIGMAGRFPGANNIRDFFRNLREGRDSVVEISPSRFCDTNFAMGNERYHVMGLLDQIDRFDRKFFNVSVREAQQMDPHQRITMELAYEALEDSGYSPASFSGSKTAVIVANADYHYLRNFEVLEPTMYSGNAQFSIAGRIARFFNSKGPAFVVDTGCSSGLMAVSLACDQIALGKADMALAMGVRVVLDPLPVNLDVDVGITSTDGKTRSFNADSDGSGSSEAAIGVLLKPLDQAIADGDHIHAVIKSTSVNSSAQSSASLTATSSAAQAEMITEAWKRAGVDPKTIDYIEAHGSGTKLGDPIEIGGIDLAFKPVTDRKHVCAVSSVKSNIGHTDKVAGLAGLAKAVLAVENGVHFPSLHFTRPNPLIDFANSATYINTTLKPWVGHNGAPRRAGVNSFGFAGNNVHVVLEQAPPRGEIAAAGPLHLVTLSSKRPCGVAANRDALLECLERDSGLSLADISFTLNTGREHFRHRDAFLVRDVRDLADQLRAASRERDEAADRAAGEPILVFSGDAPVDDAFAQRLAAQFPVFARHHAQCLAAAAVSTSATSEAVRRFAFQFAVYHLLADLGLHTENLVGTGTGDLVVGVIVGELELADALRQCGNALPAETRDLSARLASLVDLGSETKPALFVELGTGGCLSSGLRRLDSSGSQSLFTVLTLDGSAADSVLDLLRRFYLAGGTIDWAATHRHYRGRRISLPGYQFDKIRCWYKEPHSAEAYNAWYQRMYKGVGVSLPSSVESVTIREARIIELPLDNSWTETERSVARIWMEVLKLESVGLDDDFFALGGHSLFGTMVRNRIEKAFHLRLEFRDIFIHNKIRSLAASIDRLLAKGGRPAVEDVIPVLPEAAHYIAAPAQRLLWMLHRQEGAMNQAYNVPSVVRLTGPLDVDRLEHALRTVIARHEALRTHLVEVDGEPRQVVSATMDFTLERHQAGSPDDVAQLVEDFIRPFDLSQPPLIRGALIRCSETSHVVALDIHHAFFDGTSLGVLLREISELYAGGQLAPLPRSYKDYAAWRVASLERPAMREAEAFWLKQFSGAVPVLAVPADFARPAVRSYEGAVYQVSFDAALSDRVRALGKQEGATLFMVLLAGYSTLLAKLSGQDDIVIGSSVAGRTHADIEPLIGMFVNTLAFRTAPREGLPFREFLAEIREGCIQTYKHQSYPLERLAEKLRLPVDTSRNPLFDTFLVLQNMDLGDATLAEGLTMSAVEYTRKSAKYDLTFEFYDDPEGIALNVEYARDLFRADTIQAMVATLKQILDSACETPTAPLSSLPVTNAVMAK